MKKALPIIVFVLLAVAIISLAVWYNNKSDEAMRAAQVQASAAAQQAQLQIMQNFKTKDITVGTGATAANGDTLNVLYTGTLDDGTVFDASSLHGNQPFSFVLGANKVIQGWDLGLVGMKVGGKRELTIPPELGYGAQPQQGIPANSTLHFTVQLLSVSAPTSSSPAGQ